MKDKDFLDTIMPVGVVVMVTTIIVTCLCAFNYREITIDEQECYLIGNKIYCEKKDLLKGDEE